MTVAELVAQRMVDNKLNQYQLSKRSGVTQGHISKILNGEYSLPRKPTREKLGHVLDLDEDDWFRAAGILNDGQVPGARPPAVIQLTLEDPDETFDPETIVAYVESRPGKGFQDRLKAQRKRLSRPDYVRFCIGLFRAWASNSNLALTAVELSNQGA